MTRLMTRLVSRRLVTARLASGRIVIGCRAVLRTRALALMVTLLASGGVALPSAALANPHSEFPTGVDARDPTLFHVTIDYAYEMSSATIVREGVGEPVDPLAPLPKHDDLSFKQYRHTLIPKAELGVYRGTWISFAVPLVIAQARELSLASGITRDGSSTIRDGFLTADGFDARDPGTPLPAGGDLVFRGARRRGVEQLRFGLGVAPMSQLADDTKPTWKIGAELRLSVGRTMRFDRMKADSETGVSTGVHELRLWTSFARRYARAEGWFELFWQVPLTARQGSLYDDIDQSPGKFGATSTMPGQQAGAAFGLELYAINDVLHHNSVSLDLGARVVGHFEGRGYSEMWEVFAFAGDVRTEGPLVLDRDPTDPGLQAFSHPGITNIENYLETAGRIAVRAELGKRTSFGAIVDLIWKSDHVISFADAGVDRDDDNDLVNPGTDEVNPLHAAPIDLVGHRYLSEDNFGLSIGVQAQLLF